MEFVAVSLFVVYLMPWILAEAIEHPRSGWILALTLGLGWTGIGWLAACLWLMRDWPRAPRRPKLALVTRDPIVAAGFDGSWRGLAAVGLLASIGVAIWSSAPDSSRGPAGGPAELDRPRVVVRMGPGERWPSVGELLAPCRVDLVERVGAWHRVWRLEDCAGSMQGRAGWVRMEMLRASSRES